MPSNRTTRTAQATKPKARSTTAGKAKQAQPDRSRPAATTVAPHVRSKVQPGSAAQADKSSKNGRSAPAKTARGRAAAATTRQGTPTRHGTATRQQAQATPIAKRQTAAAKGQKLARKPQKPSAKQAIAGRTPAPARIAPDAHSLAHALHGLLHTMHSIQQHEEALCSLAHALEHGRRSAATLRELQRTLEHLPAHDYLHEVEALRDAAEA